MFDVFCPHCSGRRLIFTGQVRGLVNNPEGIAVRFVCWCGEVGTWRTGRGSDQAEVIWNDDHVSVRPVVAAAAAS